MALVRYAPEAEDELAAAVEWYEGERPGLGGLLVDEVSAVVSALESGDAVALPVPGLEDLGVRRVLLRRYPYAVVFTERDAVVHILAVAHVRRRPGYWTKR